MENNFIKLYLGLATVIILAYFIGFIIMAIFIKKQECFYKKTFNSLIIGSLALITTQAIVNTKLNTVLFLIPLILTVYLIIFRPKLNNLSVFLSEVKKIDYKTFPFILVILLITFCLQYFQVYNINNSSFKIIGNDYYFYSRQTYLMLESQSETLFPDFINTNFTPIPYHYGDLWFSSIFIDYLKWGNVNAYYIGYSSFFFTTLIIGANTFLAKIFNKKKSILISFLIIFISFITIGTEVFINYFISGSTASYDCYSAPKVSLIFCWFIFSLNSLLFNNKTIFIIALLILSIIYTPLIFVVYLGIGIFILSLFIMKKEIMKKEIVIVCIAGVSISLFYYFQNGKNNAADSTDLINYYTTAEGFYRILKVFIATVIRTVASYLIPLLLLLKVIGLKNILKMKVSLLFIGIFSILISAIFSYSVFHRIFDSIQFWVITSSFIGALLIIFILNYLLIHKRYIYIIILCVALIIQEKQLFFQKSDNNISERSLIHLKNINFLNNTVFFQDSSRYQSIFNTSVHVYKPLPFIGTINNTYNPICLNTGDVSIENLPEASSFLEKNKNSFIFEIYKQKNKTKSELEAQIKFINEYNVQYFVKDSKYTMSNRLNSLLGEVIYKYDGWEIYKIKT